jgi:hypothetical protein
MTGETLVPIVDDGGGAWHAILLEKRQTFAGEDEVAAFEQTVIRRGYYPFRVDPDELRELSADEPRWHALFEEHMLARSGVRWRWPTRSWRVAGCAASSVRGTTTSSRSTG